MFIKVVSPELNSVFAQGRQVSYELGSFRLLPLSPNQRQGLCHELLLPLPWPHILNINFVLPSSAFTSLQLALQLCMLPSESSVVPLLAQGRHNLSCVSDSQYGCVHFRELVQ